MWDLFCCWFSINTMVPTLFKVPSKCLWIYWIFWFGIVRNMWGFLATSHSPITSNESSPIKAYLFWVLLANLAYLLRPVDSRLVILGIFDAFFISREVSPLGALDDCWEKQNFFKFDVCQTPPESVHSINSETHSPSLAGTSFTCGLGCNCVRMLLLFSGATLGSRLGGFLRSSLRYWVNQVFLRSIWSGAPICDLRYTRYVQFGVIVPSLMNGTVDNSSSNTTWNWGETWPVSGFITRDTYPAWNVEWPRYIPAHEQGYHFFSPDISLAILHPRHKLDSPVCGDFQK